MRTRTASRRHKCWGTSQPGKKGLWSEADRYQNNSENSLDSIISMFWEGFRWIWKWANSNLECLPTCAIGLFFSNPNFSDIQIM